jgi:hypothetical protein
VSARVDSGDDRAIDPVARFRAREQPLVPCAVAATGRVARDLVARLLAREGAELGQLSGVATTTRAIEAQAATAIVVLGRAELLPWVDGAQYLGRDPGAPSLLLPTTHAPPVPASLFERAIAARFPRAQVPLAVLSPEPLVIQLGPARPLSRRALSAFLASTPLDAS